MLEKFHKKDPMTLSLDFLLALYENFASKQCLRSTIRDNRKANVRSFRNETWRRRRDGYGVPYGLAYQRGRGTRTSRVPLISRQHAPLIISLITATWTRRGL